MDMVMNKAVNTAVTAVIIGERPATLTPVTTRAPVREPAFRGRCLVWFCLAAMTLGCTGCDTLIESALQNQCDRASHDSYKQYYEHAGYDARTADRKADSDVFWDSMSQQH